MAANSAQIRAELERILASSTFSTSERSVQFLRFCVEQTLRGNHHQIKETTVALQVFGRSADYNPRTDPIVRVHARRLRKKLEDYYSTEGAGNPIQIRIPKGTYIPEAVRNFPLSAARQDPLQQPLTVQAEQKSGKRPPTDDVNRDSNPIQARRNLWPWLAATITAIGVCLAIGIQGSKPRAEASSDLALRGESRPLNAELGREQYPSWSPDGKTLAFSWATAADASPHIYLQRLGEPEPSRLTDGAKADLRPVWSPDGTQIAFIRRTDLGRFEVVRVPVRGGAENVVGLFSCPLNISDDAPALDWSHDGKFLLVAEQPSDTSSIRLILVDLATGVRRPLTNPPSGNTGDVDGKFSPDGSWVAFQRGGLGDLYVVSAQGESSAPARRLTPNNPGVRGIAWSREGRHILFGSMEGGFGWAIWQVDPDGSALHRVLPTSLDMISPAVSPDGKVLAAEQQDVETNLSEIPLGDPSSSRLIAPSTRQDYAPVYAPDQRHLAFLSTRSGAIELWIAQTDGSGSRQITHFNGAGFPVTPSWSPDSQRLLYAVRRNGATNIWTIQLNGEQAHQLTFGQNRDINPVLGPDGRYIYFNSNADGTPRIWRIELSGSRRPEPMMWDAPWSFQISRAGRSILYTNQSINLQIMQRDLITGTERMLSQSHDWIVSPSNLCVSAGAAYLIASPVRAPSTQYLIAVDLTAGAIHVLRKFDFTLPTMTYGCSVSSDNKTLLVPTVQRDQSDIYTAPLN